MVCRTTDVEPNLKSRIWSLLIACLMAMPLAANAAYLYSFGSTNVGGFSFTVQNLIQEDDDDVANDIIKFNTGFPVDNPPNVFIAFTQNTNFSFDSVETDTGTGTGVVGLWQVDFDKLPSSVGSFDATFGLITTIGGDFVSLVKPTLVISEVPEPGTLALIGVSLAALLMSSRRRGA